MSDLGLLAAVHAALTDDAVLAAAVTGIHDAVPAGAAEPYVTLAVVLDEAGGEGRRYALDVTVWSAYAGSKEIGDIMALIAAVLDRRRLGLDSGATAHVRIAATEAERDAARGLGSGTQRYTVQASFASLLTLAGPSLLAPFAARGLRHRLEPADDGTVWRDVNGVARFSGLDGHRKFRLTLAGDGDIAPPAFEALWRGQAVTVGAATRLSVHVAAGTEVVELGRTPVAGSVAAETDAGDAHPVLDVDGATVTVAAHAGFGVWVRYRPALAMLVAGWSADLDEWRPGRPWSMTLLEV